MVSGREFRLLRKHLCKYVSGKKLRLLRKLLSKTDEASDTVEKNIKTARLANKCDAPKEAVLGRKLDYLFGKATGRAHNIERSTDMLRQMERIGLHDTPANRQLMAKHFQDVLNDASNIAGTGRGGTTIRESLLMGPNGAVKIESYWDGNVLRTFKLFGGKRRFKHKP